MACVSIATMHVFGPGLVVAATGYRILQRQVHGSGLKHALAALRLIAFRAGKSVWHAPLCFVSDSYNFHDTSQNVQKVNRQNLHCKNSPPFIAEVFSLSHSVKSSSYWQCLSQLLVY